MGKEKAFKPAAYMDSISSCRPQIVMIPIAQVMAANTATAMLWL